MLWLQDRLDQDRRQQRTAMERMLATGIVPLPPCTTMTVAPTLNAVQAPEFADQDPPSHDEQPDEQFAELAEQQL